MKGTVFFIVLCFVQSSDFVSNYFFSTKNVPVIQTETHKIIQSYSFLPKKVLTPVHNQVMRFLDESEFWFIRKGKNEDGIKELKLEVIEAYSQARNTTQNDNLQKIKDSAVTYWLNTVLSLLTYLDNMSGRRATIQEMMECSYTVQKLIQKFNYYPNNLLSSVYMSLKATTRAMRKQCLRNNITTLVVDWPEVQCHDYYTSIMKLQGLKPIE